MGLSHPDERPAACMPRESNQVSFAKALADLLGAGVSADRAREISPVYALECDREQQVALLHTVARTVIEQSARAGKPPTSARLLASVQESEGQPERASDSSVDVALAQKLLMRAS